VEDERKIAGSISQGLVERHYSVDVADNAADALSLFDRNPYDLIVLDVHLPGMSGFTFCREVRKRSRRVMVLFLTAMSSTDDKLQGFQAGGDDYLVKPFDFKELLARIQALMKRSDRALDEPQVLRVEDLQVNLDSKEVTRQGKAIPLTAKEFQLLEYFIRHKNKVVSRADIAMDVWDIDFDTRTNVIDVYVNFLRKKIDRDFSPKLIHTHVGMGYILKAGS